MSTSGERGEHFQEIKWKEVSLNVSCCNTGLPPKLKPDAQTDILHSLIPVLAPRTGNDTGSIHSRKQHRSYSCSAVPHLEQRHDENFNVYQADGAGDVMTDFPDEFYEVNAGRQQVRSLSTSAAKQEEVAVVEDLLFEIYYNRYSAGGRR